MVHIMRRGDTVYEYPAIRASTNKGGRYICFMRTYGVKRTREEAIILVDAWEKENNIDTHRKL